MLLEIHSHWLLRWIVLFGNLLHVDHRIVHLRGNDLLLRVSHNISLHWGILRVLGGMILYGIVRVGFIGWHRGGLVRVGRVHWLFHQVNVVVNKFNFEIFRIEGRTTFQKILGVWARFKRHEVNDCGKAGLTYDLDLCSIPKFRDLKPSKRDRMLES